MGQDCCGTSRLRQSRENLSLSDLFYRFLYQSGNTEQGKPRDSQTLKKYLSVSIQVVHEVRDVFFVGSGLLVFVNVEKLIEVS